MVTRSSRLKQATIFGLIVGSVVFSIFYYLDPSLKYLLFIPFGGLIGLATLYVDKGE
ncbi:MAG: hypothetical protein VB016_04725 [Methanomassiliicoccaceae archaeon]|jgi:hypothetical protein|nr:hypothetical protein [Methanomassiliicoccaceae archaeon]